MDGTSKKLDFARAEAIFAAAKALVEKLKKSQRELTPVQSDQGAAPFTEEPKTEQNAPHSAAPSILNREIDQESLIRRIQIRGSALVELAIAADDQERSVDERAAQVFLNELRNELIDNVYKYSIDQSIFSNRRFRYRLESSEIASETVMFFVRRLEKDPEWIFALPMGDELQRYVYGVCMNAARTLHRRDRHVLLNSELFGLIATDNQAAELEAKDEVEYLRRIVTKFDEADMRMFELLLNGHPTSSIASRLEMTPNAVYQRLFRLRAKLRDELNERQD